MQLVDCVVLGGKHGNNDISTSKETNDEIEFATVDMMRAKAEQYRAEAVRLRAEGKMFEDVGSYYVELASKAEAEAFIAQSDRTTHEMVQDAVRKLKIKDAEGKDQLLVVEKARSELEREIARNKDLAIKTSNRSNYHRPQSKGNGADRRGPMSSTEPEKGVTGESRSGGIRGVEGKPFNVIKGVEAQAAMKAETKA